MVVIPVILKSQNSYHPKYYYTILTHYYEIPLFLRMWYDRYDHPYFMRLSGMAGSMTIVWTRYDRRYGWVSYLYTHTIVIKLFYRQIYAIYHP